MKRKGILKNKDFEAALRAGTATFFILSCFLLAVYFMGTVYNAVELTAFGNKTVFFERVGTDEYMLFGNRIYFPIVSFCQKLVWFIKAYSPGIIKLLNLCIAKLEELLELLVYGF